jgi:hypothetical protein
MSTVRLTRGGRVILYKHFDGTEASLFPAVAKESSRLMKQGDAFELMKATYKLLIEAENKGQLIYKR